MKMEKNIRICLLLVLVMLCVIGTASATDSVNNNLTDTNVEETLSVDESQALDSPGDGGIIGENADDTLLASDNNEKLSSKTITVASEGGDYTSISAAVAAADGGDTIFIKNGEYTEASISGVSKQLSFIGESQDGVIIRSSGTTGFFVTTESGYTSLTFNNITFKEINGGSGATISIGGNGDVNIVNCTFDSCYSRYGSMRIFTSGTALIDSCKIVNSQSSTGSYSSAMDFGGSGTAPYTVKNTIIENSSMKSTSTASYIFGMIYNEGTARTLTLDNVTLVNCSCPKSSGLISTKGNMNIKNSRLVDNDISRDGIFGLIFVSGGKAVSVETTLIANNVNSNYILTSNSASASFNLTNNNIQNNTVKNGFTNPSYDAYDLDANYWGSNSLPEGVTASTWIVENNGVYQLNTGEAIDVIIPGLNDGEEPEVPADAIYVATDGNDNNSGSIDAPVATIAKAVELANNASGVIIITEGTYIENNIVLDNAKPISITGQGNVVINGNASSNSIFKMTGGAANFTNIVFTNNSPRYGGAINLGSNVNINVLINNCTFTDIKSTSRGGAVYGATIKGRLTVIDSKFRNIDSGSWGAITFATSSQSDGVAVDITGSTFENNVANNGAALYLRAANVNIADSIFINNTAANAPGAIYLYNATATIDNCVICNNTAGGKGVAISSTPVSGAVTTLTITNSIIENNNGNGQVLPAIYADMNLIDISYSSLVNELSVETRTATGYDAVYGQGVIIANNNWWGSNDPSSNATGINITIDKWVILNVVANATEVLPGDVVSLTVDFNHVNTTSGEIEELTGGPVPKTYDVQLTSTSGTIAPATLKIENGAVKSAIYNVADIDAIISIMSQSAIVNLSFAPAAEPYYGIIYVSKSGDDANNGSEEFPVASIAKAVELALVSGGSGQIVISEGTYTGFDYRVTGNLTITGVGNVVLDGENQGRLFYMNYGDNADKLVIANLTVTNVKHNYGAFVYSLAKELIIENVTAVNNEGIGSLVSNSGKMTIKDSTFKDMTSATLITLSGNGDVSIINTVIENITVDTAGTSNFGIIYANGRGTLTVQSSKISNNTVRQSVIRDTGNTNIEIKESEFVNNHMEGSYADGGVVYAYSKLNVEESTFINNDACGNGGAIYVGWRAEASITKSVFNNNSAGSDKKGDAIYSANKLSINYSVILSDKTGPVIYHEGEDEADAQYNWWGTNDDPRTLVAVGSYEDDYGDDVDCSIDTSNWVVMTVSNNMTSEISIGDKVAFTVDFTNYIDSTGTAKALADSIPEVEVSASALNGEMDINQATTENNVANFVYTALDNETDVVTIVSANAVNTTEINFNEPVIEVIYVSMSGDDSNNGSESAPVATIAKALELAERGQIVILEGTYTTGDLGIVMDGDLNITGVGKVVIDAQNNNRILYVGQNATVVLKNLIMINGYGDYGSGALLGNSNYLTLINCTLANSTAGENNGGAIYNVGKLTIINSTIANNTAKEGGAIFANDALAKDVAIVIENSIIENNIATGNENLGGGAIFAQQLTGLTVTGTTFRNNKALGESCGGAIFTSHSTASMTITDSEFIANHANGKTDIGGGAIYMVGTSNYERKGTLTISNTLFEDNTADSNGGAIYARATTVNVKNSVLINNTDANGLAVFGYKTEQVSPAITLNDNWWGSNDSPKDLVGGNGYKPTLNRWAILTISNDTAISEGNTVKLTVSINTYTTGSENGTLSNPINVARPVTIKTTSADISGVLENGEFTTNYTVPSGLKIISTSVDSETVVLFVITCETTVELSDIVADMGDNVEVSINVTTNDGTVINTGNVELYFADDLVATIPVVNGVAKANVVIAKDIGNYTITAKYIDPTEEFANNQSTATLRVVGINNIVTPETLNNFFDENGVLKSDVPFDELIFDGEFKDLGTLTINKAISIKGDVAVFNNTALKITADNVKVSDIEFVADKLFNDDAVIFVSGNNVVLENNLIDYDAPNTGDAYAIYADSADGLNIIDTAIFYDGKLGEDTKTIALYAIDSDDMVVKNTTIDATVPSVAVGYGPAPDYAPTVMSAGAIFEGCSNLTFEDNNVYVDYNQSSGYSDTLYGVKIVGGDNSDITGNDIQLNGHAYAYAVSIDGKNLTISDNSIESNSDDSYAAGLNIEKDSTGTVSNNNISASAEDVSYAVYADDWGAGSNLTFDNNNITAESNTAYGISVNADEVVISNNNVSTKANYTTGVAVKANATISNNKIAVNGSNVGNSTDAYPMIPVQTTGIYAEDSNVTIINNDISSTGNKTVDLSNVNGTIKDNKLKANGTSGDASITANNATIIMDNNKSSEDPVVAPVIKIVAKSKNVLYSSIYKVRITSDGKSIGAGKVVSIKIAGKTIKVKTDKNGYASIKMLYKPAKYSVKITYGKLKKTVKLNVKSIIVAKNIFGSKSASFNKITVTLRKVDNKYVKGKYVSIKFNGRTFKVKTNSKGVAVFKLNKNLFKKLTLGKKYSYKVIYGKDSALKTINIRK